MLNFSFFLGLVKWNSISISIFHFLSIRDIKKRIWISFFVFALLVIEKQGDDRGNEGPWVIRPFNFQFKIQNWKSMSIFDFPFFFFLYKG